MERETQRERHRERARVRDREREVGMQPSETSQKVRGCALRMSPGSKVESMASLNALLIVSCITGGIREIRERPCAAS